MGGTTNQSLSQNKKINKMIFNVITFAKSLLLCQVMYSQASEIKTSLRSHDFFLPSMLRRIYELALDLGNEEAVKVRALSIGGESAFCLAYYFAIIESKGKEGELSHFHDMTTQTQRFCMVFPRRSYSKELKIHPTLSNSAMPLGLPQVSDVTCV